LVGTLVAGNVLLNAASLSAADVRIQQDNSLIVVSAGEQPLFKYRYGDGPFKPYIKELFTPAGVQVLRDSPADHVHHRGVMFGIFVNGVDYWSEQPKAGKQVHVELGPVQSQSINNNSRSTFSQRLQWIPPGADRPVLVERRAITLHLAPDLKATLVTWQTSLQPGEGAGTVKLTGSHYDGLGVRFVASMDKVGRFLHASDTAGTVVRGTERVTPDRWAAYTAPADGNPVTVAVFDDPQNTRHPAGLFTMLDPFAFLSATPNIWKTPLELAPGQALNLRYGVAVWDGETAKEAIEATYRKWLELAQ
jgi:hypothetical protein